MDPFETYRETPRVDRRRRPAVRRARTLTYWEALQIAADFREDEPSGEYERGQDELLAELFPIAGVATGDRAEAINREIRALRAREALAGTPGYVVGVNGVNGDPPIRLCRFDTEAEAVAFVGTLENHEVEGIYYIAPPEDEEEDRLGVPPPA